jgi:hypothetical protein
MDYKRYLESINNADDINDDFDLGLLSELEQEAPKELHENVMKLVRQESKQVKYFNYKRYMPVAAAAAIIVGVLSFANSTIKDNRISHNLPNNTNKLSVEKNTETHEKIDNQNNEENAKIDVEPNTESNKDKNQTVTDEKSVENNPKEYVAVKDNSSKSQGKKADKSVKQNNKKELVAVNDTPKTNAAQQSEAQNNTVDTAAVEINNDAESIKEEQGVKYGIAFDSQRQSLIAKSYTQDMTVNYEVELGIEQFDIIDFINSRGSILSYRIYRLSKEDASMLDALLSSQQVQKKVVSESLESDSVIVKLIIGKK